MISLRTDEDKKIFYRDIPLSGGIFCLKSGIRSVCMTKRTKRISALLPITAFIVLLCGCKAAGSYEGKALTDRAKSLHTSLESAHITVTDMNNELVQDISYRFAGDIMQYMYYGKDSESGKEYYEFNNGTELDYITLPDETEWSFKSKGEDGYYNYSRASRHYFADGSKLFTDYAAAVSGSEEGYSLYGGKSLTLSYDTEKLRQYEGMADITAYREVFEFDEEGFCAEFCTSYTLSDGSSRRYIVHTEKRDPAEPIERTELK